MPSEKQLQYRFNDFKVDLAHRSLRRAGQAIAINARTLDLLVFFLEHPQRLVTRNELMEALWFGEHVEENDLSQHIFLLRKALSGNQLNDSTGDNLLVTVPGHGYEFIARVTIEMTDRDPGSTQTSVLRQPTSRTRISTEVVYDRAHNHREDDADSAVPESDGEGRIKRIAASVFNPGPWQLAAGVAAFVLLAVVGWFGWRWVHRPGPESVRVLVADFENSTGNPDFDQTIRTALIIDLRQSPYLEVATRDQVNRVLLQIKQTGDAPATGGSDKQPGTSPVRAACRSLQDDVYLTGEIRPLGQKYLVTIRAFNCATGSSRATSRGVADSADTVLLVLDKVALDLREQLGEPAHSVARFRKPLFTEGAGSLEVLRAYSDASYLALEGQLREALTVYRRVVGLSPKFAMAYADMGTVYNQLGEREAAAANLTHAYELRDTAGELNRLSIVALYHRTVTHDIQASIRNDKEWAEKYPHDPSPLVDLADLETQIGKPALALDPAKRALALNSEDNASYVVLARAQMHTGQFEEAAHTCAQAISHHVDDARIHGFLMQIAFLRLDQPAMDEQMAWARTQQVDQPDGQHNDLDAQAYMQSQQGLMDFALGKAKAAEAIFARVIDGYRKQGKTGEANRIAGEIARTEAELGNIETAYSMLSRLPEGASSADIPVAWAETGEVSRAAAILKRDLDAFPADTLGLEYVGPQIRAAIALNQHRPEDAIAALTPALPYDLRLFGAPALRGKAYLADNRPVEAETEFHKILDHPGIEPFSYNYPLAQLGAARALARQGKVVEAGFAYKIVLQIWKDADADLPRLREARAEYAHLDEALPSNGRPHEEPRKPATKSAAKPRHK